MKKKSGFTLIELLAVIVILAIIALIATPMVLKYIESSKKGAFRESVSNIETEALNYVASKNLNNEEVVYTIKIDVQDLNFKGKKDNYQGYIYVYSSSEVESYITDGNYQYNNNRNEIKDSRKDVILKVKEGKTAIIDDKRNFVYSFYQSPVATNYRTNLTIDILNDTFEATNGGSIEFVKGGPNNCCYSTGAGVVLKDKEGNKVKTYKIIIFGDNNGHGMLNTTSTSKIKSIITDSSKYANEFTFASDLNFDGRIDKSDLDLIVSIVKGEYYIDQIEKKVIKSS